MKIKTIFQQWFGKNANPQKQKIVQFVKFLIIFSFFASLFYIIPFSSVLEVIKSSNPSLLFIGIILGLPNVYIKSIRLGLLTQKQGLPLSFNKLFVVNLIVKFYLLFLPGALIGSGIRWARIKSVGKSVEALGAIAFNRVLEVFVVIVSGSLLYIAGVNKEIIDLKNVILIAISLIFIFIIFIYSIRFLTSFFEKKASRKFKHSYIQKIWSYFNRFIKSINIYTKLPLKESLIFFGVSLLAYMVGLTSYVLLARSVGIGLSIFDLGWTQSVVFLIAFTPISIAGGLGIREVSLVFMLSLFEVEAEVALAFSLMILSRGFLLGILGGVIEFFELLKTRKVDN